MRERLLALAMGFLASCVSDLGDDPYADVSLDSIAQQAGHTGSLLRKALHTVIDDHDRLTYTATWEAIETADQHPTDENLVLDIYRNRGFAKTNHKGFHREHTWPKSYGFPKYNSKNYPYTDCHALFAADASYNMSRHNKPYGDCTSPCARKPVDDAGNAANFRFTDGWEVWEGRRGDVARALLYLDVRYEGGTHNETGAEEPDLVLTDDLSKVATTAGNASKAYMGSLSTLLMWHYDDPVDARELDRNDVVESFQGNRNPFVDHPEWIDCIFQDACDL